MTLSADAKSELENLKNKYHLMSLQLEAARDESKQLSHSLALKEDVIASLEEQLVGLVLI